MATRTERRLDMELGALAADCARSAAPIFARHGWKYGRGEESAVPHEGRLRGTILRLLEGVRDQPNDCYRASGRFHVSAETEDGVTSYGVSLGLGEVTDAE